MIYYVCNQERLQNKPKEQNKMMTKERQLVEYEIEVRKMASDGRELLYKESDKLNDEIKEKICLLNNLHGRLQFMKIKKKNL